MEKDNTTADSIITEAKERFEASQDGSEYNRQNAEDDIKFAKLSQQWPDDVEDQRLKEGRPCLTINKLKPFIRQVVNDARQNKPAIKVSPNDNGADVDTAEVINGLVRAIERRSHADVAYDTAFDHAVSGGFGFFQLGIDYVNDNSFSQEIKIHRIANPLMVHWDTDSTEFDASDWNYAFVSEFYQEDEYEAMHPNAKKIDFESDQRVFHEQYMEDDQIQVAQYWLCEPIQKRLLQLSNGQAVQQEELIENVKSAFAEIEKSPSGMSDEELVGFFLENNGLQVVGERDVDSKKVVRRLINGVEILEEEEWPGSTIPIFPVWGEEVMIDGRRYFLSLIRDAIDSQRMFNYWRSASTELVALAPRAPFIGPAGFVPKNDKKWGTANTRSHPYLEYEGQVMPQRQPFAGIPAGVIQESLNASDDMKAITGIYDPALGARSNETSGRAILARQKESDVSNFHFVDNLSRAIQSCGKAIVELIPHVYSQQETVRILGEDQKEKVVKLGTGERQDQEGKRIYNLSVGTYDVTVKTGPSYASQREETRETLIEIMRAVPGAAPYMADMIAEHMDFQGADKFAKRAQMMLPPNIQKAEAQEDMEGMPPEMQQMMMVAEQTIEELQKQVEQLQNEQAPDMAKNQIEQSKVQVDAKAKQDANVLAARKLDLEERKIKLEEDKALAEELRAGAGPQPEPVNQAPITLQNFTAPEQAEEDGRLKALIAEAVTNLAKVNSSPIRVERDENGMITGASRELMDADNRIIGATPS